jgi:phospholipid transport system substrate-binding protein
MKFSSYRAVLLALAPVAALIAPAPVAAAVVANKDARTFIDTLAQEGFTVLRTRERKAGRAEFRRLLQQHFAVDSIGDRLINRWRNKITPAQYQAYKAVFPEYVLNLYADRIYDFAKADFKILRAVERNDVGAVSTSVRQPGAAQPINSIWAVQRFGGNYQVTNLTVGGINLSVTQAADFDSYVQRHGFDALVKFMKTSR